MAHRETLDTRYQQLLQKQRELEKGGYLPPVEFYELTLIEALYLPEAKFDDLEDFANITRAMARVQDHLQQSILYHYYDRG